MIGLSAQNIDFDDTEECEDLERTETLVAPLVAQCFHHLSVNWNGTIPALISSHFRNSSSTFSKNPNVLTSPRIRKSTGTVLGHTAAIDVGMMWRSGAM